VSATAASCARKLRRGALRGNRFRIVVRELEAEVQGLEQRLQSIAAQGVPNYFGEQRFGRAGSNLRSAGRLFANPRLRLSRQQRGLALSAARALLFNAVLDRRVRAGCWDRALPGDALQLHGSHSYFIAGAVDAELQARLAALDVHPTGPLYGRGTPAPQGEALALESAVLADYPGWLAGLEAAGLEAARRALRLVVEDLQWQRPAADELQLAFALPAGGYATSVLREIVSGR
jgi:tRNA pseudouridine13 synthase